MQRFLKFIHISLLSFFLVFLSNVPIRAQEVQADNFETSLHSSYSVDTQGKTLVEHLFRIKNLTPTVFINKYSLQINSNQINQIQVQQDGNKIEYELDQTDNYTQISLSFPEETVGKDKVNQFSISYQNPDIASIKGKVLELNVPSMNNAQDYQRHTVTLITPVQYGYPNRITPEYDQIQIIDQTTTQIDYQQIEGQGISAIFGTEQIYQLGLKYHLSNPNNQPGLTQISLPPDTPYQKLFYQLLEPRPEKIEADEDGNWIATYLVPAAQAIEVQAQALARVTVEPIDNSLSIEPQPFHLSSQPYWPVNNDQIKEISQQLANAREIYHYTIDELEYHPTASQELANLERLGAVGALDNPQQAVCQEFSDLFITLARAKQIPARQAIGYAHSENERLRPLSFAGDVLHAWPEYYSTEGKEWVPIDPTWGDTTQGVDYFNQFDLNHVVFAYNGQDSQRPYPAGAYKEPNRETKDIEVSFAQEFPQLEPEISIQLKPTKFGPWAVPGFYQLKISNQTGVAWYGNQLAISSQDEQKKQLTIEPKQLEFDLLPFETKEVKLKLYNDQEWLYTQQSIDLTVTTKDQKQLNYEQSVKTLGQIRQVYTQQTGLYGLGAIVLIITLAAGGLLVYRRRQ